MNLLVIIKTSTSYLLLRPFFPLLLGYQGTSLLLLLSFIFNISTLRTMLLGVCRTISPIGPAHGLFGGRFILLFFACLSTVVTKALSLGVLLHILVYNNSSLSTKIAYSSLLFIPQVIMSLFCTIGLCKKSFQKVFRHPDLFLQPSGEKKVYWNVKCVCMFLTYYGFNQ